jgi:uncharacterized protein YecE (DUF72 family)
MSGAKERARGPEESAARPAAVGTSGFSYADWKGSFYPEWLPARDWFHFYATTFNAVEINLSFYRPVSEKILLRWKSSAPGDFRFVLKASQEITHRKRLEDCENELSAMVDEFAPLGEQLACILFQLPPSLLRDETRLVAFLRQAATSLARLLRSTGLAMEFRHVSWNIPATLERLAAHGWGMVLHDMARAGLWRVQDDRIHTNGWVLTPGELLDRSTRLLYLRFHGTTAKYAGEYGPNGLRPWASLAKPALGRGFAVHAYFNNTSAAAAPRDARTLKALLEGP